MESPFQIILDIWEGNPDIDVDVVRSNGVVGLVVRLNDMRGGHHMDERFYVNWEKAKSFPVQAMYYVYNPWVSGRANFEWMKAHMPADYGRRRLFIDVEVRYEGYSPTAYRKEVEIFLALAREHYTVTVYSGGGFLGLLDRWLADEYWWAAYPLALNGIKTWASYLAVLETLSMKAFTSSCPGKVILWQCSGDKVKHLEGFNGRAVDVNVIEGTLQEVADWFGCELEDGGGVPVVDYKTYPMGLVTKTTARVKEPFGFVVYDLGGNDDYDPNEQAAPIEADALASGKAPVAKWRFTTHWYGQNQKSATDAAWPKKEGDLPFQAFVDAVKNRSPYAVVVEITDGTNFEGKPEDPFYLSYAAEQFVARVDGWLKANKPGVKVLVGSSNAFIEASSPRAGDMNAWVGKYPSYIIQPSPAVDSSFPAGTAKPAHLDNRLTWEMWQYAGNLAIFNVASCGPVNDWLNYTPGEIPDEPEEPDGEPEPEEDTEELKLLKENNALLKKIAAHFA